jgi:hypothetical protein
MIDFIYRRIANIKTLYRTIFPEAKKVYEREEEVQRLNTKAVSDKEETAKFYRKYEDSVERKSQASEESQVESREEEPRSPKGKGKVEGESSISKSKGYKKEIEELKTENNTLRGILDAVPANVLQENIYKLECKLKETTDRLTMSRAETARLRGLKGTKPSATTAELTKDLEAAKSTIDRYNSDVQKLTTRHETAVALIKDQKNNIDDLVSKLQRAEETNEELTKCMAQLSAQTLSTGISTSGDDINTLLVLNETLTYKLGQAKEVNEDCGKEIEELKLKIEEGTRIQSKSENSIKELTLKLAKETKVGDELNVWTVEKDMEIKTLTEQKKRLQAKLDTSENLAKEQSNAISVPSTEGAIIKDLKERNSNLENEVGRLTTRLDCVVSMHTERSRHDEEARTKIIKINKEFGASKVKQIRQVVDKVNEYRDAIDEATKIHERLLACNSNAIEHAKLYDANKLKNDKHNQRTLEAAAAEYEKELAILHERVKIANVGLKETVKDINTSNTKYRDDINAVYTVMKEQQLITEELVLTPIERLIIDTPVSFKMKTSFKDDIGKGTLEIMGNITRNQRGSSTESSPASSPMSSHNTTPNTSPNASPRGEKPTLKLISKAQSKEEDKPTLRPIPKAQSKTLTKEEAAIMTGAVSFLKPTPRPSIETKPILSMRKLAVSNKTGLSTTSKVIIPKTNVSELSKTFQTTTSTSTTPIGDKNMTGNEVD